ncbi:MAG TPA: cytochrome c oxidase subunit II [Acidimicrobiales bacterium]|nr:cytochrome c oxidase subunit II [Acidimicrobiales bacterium]
MSTSASAPSRATPGRRRLGRVGVLGALALALSGCTYNFENYTGATTQGHQTFKLFQGFDITALAVGIFVWALIFWCILAYRRKSPDHWPRQTRYNMPWEVAYTTIPILIVAVLFGYTVVTENSVDAVAANPANHMSIQAFQWGWRFTYDNPPGSTQAVTLLSDPNHYATFELPLNEVTQVDLTTADVIHEFDVPRFDFQRYAQSGIENTFDLTPTQTGTYIGRCGQFCGLHHDLMIFYVKVVQPATFQTWLQQQERSST